MKSKLTALTMITLVLLSSSSLPVCASQVIVQNELTGASDEATSKTPKTNHVDDTYNVNKSDQVTGASSEKETFEAVPSPEKTSRDSRQAPPDLEDKWNFDDTNEWSNFAYADGNATRLVVGVKGQNLASYLELEKIAAKYQAPIVNAISIRGEITAVVVELYLGLVTAFVEEIRIDRLASYIEPSMKVQAQLVPNDPYWSVQWGPQKIEADWAWNTTIGDPSILVAVVDTGIDYTHPDLAANYVPLGYDWVNNDSDPWDDSGHGTHVSGTIAAVINNGIGTAGLANVRIMAEKVLDSGGGGYYEWVASGIIHAVDQGADIISMSLGGYGHSELAYEAIKYAYDSGVLVIAAAGNDNTDMKLYPAGYDEVVAVAATDQWDSKAWFSNWGNWIELAAPGVDIYSTVPGGHTYASGTSMATPHVSGVAALVWSRFPDKSRDWVRLWLRYTADDLGELGFDEYFGYGRINARRAVEQSPPGHDLIAFEWKNPPYVEPASTATIDATVLNFGDTDETYIAVQLLANGTIADSTYIAFLASGEKATTSLVWSPMVEGLYNVTLYVVPVANETSVVNNVLWASIYVGFPVKAAILHSAGNVYGDIITNWQVLNTQWYRFGDTMVYVDYTTLNKDNIGYEDLTLTQADVLIISCASDPGMGWQFTDSEIAAIKRYVFEGHGLIATAGTLYYRVPNNNKLASLFGLNGTVAWRSTGTDLLHLLNTTHPLFKRIPNPFVFSYVGTSLPPDGRWDSNELVGGKYLALGQYQESALVTYRGLAYLSPWLEVIPAYYHHHLQLLYNAITWSRYQKPAHELEVSLYCPTHLKPGKSALVNATVENMGLNYETTVDLFLLLDGAHVANLTVPTLAAGESATLSYLWTPTIGTYNVTAYAPPVLGEKETFNNVNTLLSRVSYAIVIGFIETHGESLHSDSLKIYYQSLGHIVGTIYSSLTPELLVDYDILILGEDWSNYAWPPSEIAAIQDFISSGKGFIGIGDELAHPVQEILSEYGITYTGSYGSPGSSSNFDHSHPIMKDVNYIYASYPVNSLRAVQPGYWIANDADNVHMLIAGAEVGGYVLCMSDDFAAYVYDDDNGIMFVNIAEWMAERYPHDLAVSLESPAFLKLGDSILLNATVLNHGLNNETYVELQLLLNGIIVDSTVIPELPIKGSYTLRQLWTPTVEGTYNVTAYASPIPGEGSIADNIATKLVKARPIKGYTLFDQTHGTDSIADYNIWVSNLTNRGYMIETLNFGRITSTILEMYEVFVIPQARYDYTSAELSAMQNFVSNGGGLLIIGDDSPWIYTSLTSFAGIIWTSGGYGGYTNVITPHPVTIGVTTAYFGAPTSDLHAASPAVDLIRDPFGYVMLAVSELPAGKVIGIADESAIDDSGIGYADNLRLANNMIDWMSILYEHDVAIVTVVSSTNEVLVGDTADVAVVAENQGDFAESFTVGVFAQSLNSTRIYFDPSSYIFGAGTVSVGDRFNVKIKVEDVTDLYAWQIKVYYFPQLLNLASGACPTGHVFEGKDYISLDALQETHNLILRNLTNVDLRSPLYTVWRYLMTRELNLVGWRDSDNSGGLTVSDIVWLQPIGYESQYFRVETMEWEGSTIRMTVEISSTMFGATLLGIQPGFNGNGTLCKIEFEIKAIPSPGETLSCDLTIDNEDTYLLDSNGDEVPSVHKENGYYELGAVGPPPPGKWYKIGTKTVIDLAPGERVTLAFTWNTTGVIPSDYVIGAEASVVLGETDTADNKYVDGFIRIMKPPSASFTYSPSYPKPSETVTFDATSSTPNGGTITSYIWNFGDGNITATTTPLLAHQYAFSGLYNVTLTITDSEGLADSMWKTIYVFTRDIAIVDVAPSTDQTYRGWAISVNVTILNEGEVTETLEVILYCNITAGDIIGTQILEDLLPGEYRTLTFLWNTTSMKTCLSYTMTAHTVPVLGETDIADNTLSGITTVKVKSLGDINGDGKIDIRDIATVARAFGSYPGHIRWNPEVDINQDGKIDVRDIAIVAKNFGFTDT